MVLSVGLCGGLSASVVLFVWVWALVRWRVFICTQMEEVNKKRPRDREGEGMAQKAIELISTLCEGDVDSSRSLAGRVAKMLDPTTITMADKADAFDEIKTSLLSGADDTTRLVFTFNYLNARSRPGARACACARMRKHTRMC